jgi:hypothetical protein
MNPARHFALVSALTFGCFAQNMFAADRIAAGKWEAAMTTDGETRTVSYCVNPEDATAINGDTKTGRESAEKKGGARCKVIAYEANGDVVSYSLLCGARTMTDKTSYHGDTSEGTKTVTFECKTSTTTLKSKRVGPC